MTRFAITLLFLALCLMSSPAIVMAADAEANERPVVVKTREMTVEGRYLVWPVDRSNHRKHFSTFIFSENGKEIRRVLAFLNGNDIHNWHFADIADLKGRKITLTCPDYKPEKGGWDKVRQSDEFMPKSYTDDNGREFYELYREPGRPQFHFSAMRGWLNDPNGLVYANRQFHLFFQHVPYGGVGKCWGHAISDDLVRWKQMPVAILPEPGTQAYSGSAIVDRNNVTGLKTKQNKGDLIIAYYTLIRRPDEHMAFSNDNGMTFTHGPKVEKPLRHPPGHGGRDPKVIWHEPTKKWIAVIFDWRPNSTRKEWGEEKGRGVVFYSSTDLLNWEFESRFVGKGPYECMELYELPVDSDPTKTKWVLQEASSRYYLGIFDGHEFKSDHPDGFMQTVSKSMYAAQTWNNIPGKDGRRIQIAWARIGGGRGWNQQMFFPVELTLRTTDEGIRLCTNPVREIANLYRDRVYEWQNVRLGKDKPTAFEVDDQLLDLTFELAVSDDVIVHFNLLGNGSNYGNANYAGKLGRILPKDGKIKARIVKDVNTIELFAFDGEIYLPHGARHAPTNRTLSFTLKAGECEIESLVVHGLKSAWERE